MLCTVFRFVQLTIGTRVSKLIVTEPPTPMNQHLTPVTEKCEEKQGLLRMYYRGKALCYYMQSMANAMAYLRIIETTTYDQGWRSL